MVKKAICYGLVVLLCCSCGEYYKVQKSNEPDVKFQYAKMCFEKGKYSRAYSLLEDIVTYYKGTDKAEETLYLLARSHFMRANTSPPITAAIRKGNIPKWRTTTRD